MNTKYTLLLIAGLFFAASTHAQDRDYDHREERYTNDFRQDRREDMHYRVQIYSLQQRLDHDINELDRANQFGDWQKARHEKWEMAEIRDQIRHINYRRLRCSAK
jgi:hypothetical protein